MINRRKKYTFLKITKGAGHQFNLLIILALIFCVALGCSSDKSTSATPIGEKVKASTELNIKPKRLESYTVRGFKFSYYLVPKNLNNEELIKTAQEVRNQEQDAQLILVDDDSGLAEYVNYAKEISKGNHADAKMPKEWANEHIVGNVQKYLSGKWMLCEGNGYREIAELK
jgi:hypothetical protein